MHTAGQFRLVDVGFEHAGMGHIKVYSYDPVGSQSPPPRTHPPVGGRQRVAQALRPPAAVGVVRKKKCTTTSKKQCRPRGVREDGPNESL